MNIPLLMVIAFLLLTLIVGLYYSRKTTTLREYAVGNKQFATAALVATMLATRFGGEMMRDIEQVYNNGLYWILLALSSSLPFLLLSRLVLRMGLFMQHLSMPERALFLKKQVKSQDHILLQPTEIALDNLIKKLEIALEQEMGSVPRLLVEHKDGTAFFHNPI